MTTTIEVTPEELQLLEQAREHKKQLLERRAYALELLSVAANYAAWLVENNTGSSYSTFRNEFGYQGRAHDVGSFYKDVMNAIDIISGGLI